MCSKMFKFFFSGQTHSEELVILKTKQNKTKHHKLDSFIFLSTKIFLVEMKSMD